MFDFQKNCGLQIVKDLVKDDESLSRVYGFILYTEKNPYVAKVLRDEDFWDALDCISGSNWPIFSVRPLRKGQYNNPTSDGNYISYMMPTWNEPMCNIPVLHDFGLKKSEDLPLFVVFMWDDNDELREIAIPIRGNDVDSVYHSIEDKRTVNVFRNVAVALDALNFKYSIISKGKHLSRVAEFLNVFM